MFDCGLYTRQCCISLLTIYLLIAQVGPVKPGIQTHVKESMPSIQLPPLTQGELEHSSIPEDRWKI